MNRRKVTVIATIGLGAVCLVSATGYCPVRGELRAVHDTLRTEFMVNLEAWLDDYKKANGANPEHLADASRLNCPTVNVRAKAVSHRLSNENVVRQAGSHYRSMVSGT